jgi:hypothetical protein
MVHVPLLNIRERTLSSRTMFESAIYQEDQWHPGPNMDHRNEVHTRSDQGELLQLVPARTRSQMMAYMREGGSNPMPMLLSPLPAHPPVFTGL